MSAPTSYHFRSLQLLLAVLLITYAGFIVPSYWFENVAQFTNYNLLSQQLLDSSAVYIVNIAINSTFVIYALIAIVFSWSLFYLALIMTFVLITSVSYSITWLVCFTLTILAWNQFLLHYSGQAYSDVDGQPILPQIVVEKHDSATQTDHNMNHINLVRNANFYENNIANSAIWFQKQSTLNLINKQTTTMKIENFNLYEELHKI